ncbi:alpha/beta hydrolase [Streptomyces scopuliridis]|uniref:alpha/beta hydrolase n=1 Tax=Streptomyces scopuliridis TaxID=452529 RepID=UPI00369400F1
MLWDAGGPGIPPSDSKTLRATLPNWLAGYDIGVVVEPWVTRKIAGECLDVARTVSSGAPLGDEPLPEVARVCDFSNLAFTEESYSAAVHSLEDAEGEELSGVYAYSFGAVRATALMGGEFKSDPWFVLDAPAPIPGTHATTVLGERSVAMQRAIGLTVGECKEWSSQCDKAVAEALKSLGSSPGSQEGPGEQEFEAMTGLLAMESDLEKNEPFISRILESGGQVPAEFRQTLKKASYSFTRRFGEGQVLPELVGYWANVCTAYAGWGHGTGSPSKDPLGYSMARFHGACVSTGGRVDWAMPEKPAKNILIAVNEQDPVTPRTAGESWRQALPEAEQIDYTHLGHTVLPPEHEEDVNRWLQGLR